VGDNRLDVRNRIVTQLFVPRIFPVGPEKYPPSKLKVTDLSDLLLISIFEGLDLFQAVVKVLASEDLLGGREITILVLGQCLIAEKIAHQNVWVLTVIIGVIFRVDNLCGIIVLFLILLLFWLRFVNIDHTFDVRLDFLIPKAPSGHSFMDKLSLEQVIDGRSHVWVFLHHGIHDILAFLVIVPFDGRRLLLQNLVEQGCDIVVTKGKLKSDQFILSNAQRKNIGLRAVLDSTSNFWGHVVRRTANCCGEINVFLELPCYTKISQLHYLLF